MVNAKDKITESERREFIRLSYKSPLMYKVCKRTTLSKLLEGYTHNISQSGLMCTLKESVPKNSTLWLKLDSGALNLCSELERRCVILQQGILGKIAWLKKNKDKSVDIGVRFLTREEKQRFKFPE
jgi:c-di-GMP-binding flagellar brake protein YcgR